MDKATLPDSLTEREHEILTRLASGASDQVIADELFLSLNTVKWHNRQIYSKLGVGSRTQAIAHAKTFGLLDSIVSSSALPADKHQLPVPSTPFIGRSREIAEAMQLLMASRLLTLTGVGGTGKTRLAVQLAAEVSEAFSDGVYFVDLAPLSDSELVVNAIAGALGGMENTTEPLLKMLKRVLAQREMLLVMDNFEHVLEAASVVSELLMAAPRLKVLATSRESLHLAGEQEYPVPPLSLPKAEVVTVQSIAASEAGSLFVQRAQMTLPRFEVHDDNAPAIAQICARLDGLPLAIELAAVRCKLLTPQALLERLGKPNSDAALHTLTTGARDAPPRQRTLRNSIEWSYNLLEEGEKTLFARLAVFRGGRSLEAIEAICGVDLSIDVFDGLASLVDKSLVQQKETAKGEPRFVLLEMIQEYARERLDASGEAQTIQRRHAEYFVELAERAEPEVRLAGFDYWYERFEIDIDNVRAVLEWSLNDGDVTLGVRLAGALCLFWYGKAPLVEGEHWTGQLLKRLAEVPRIYHPQFLMSAAHVAKLHDLELAKRLYQQMLEVSRELDATSHIAWALVFLGYTMQREPDAALAVVDEGLALFRELNHLPGIAQTLNIIGEITRFNGNDELAKQAYEQCLIICQQTGELRRTCYICYNLAYIAQHEGNHEHALELARRGLRLSYERQDKHEMANGCTVVAGSLAPLGQPERAARLLGACETAVERLGAIHHSSDKPEVQRIIATVRGQLDDATFNEELAAGRTMTLEQAAAYALGE